MTAPTAPTITPDGNRLWRSLMEMAEIGPIPGGGSGRQALTDLDAAGRALFSGWCRESGLTLETDAIGNLFARRPGTDPTLPPVMMGSHLDTQPTGGRFDGVYGVLAALEVVRSLNDAGRHTRHPLEIAVWMNEEGARYAPPMMGSGVFTGRFTEAEILDKVAQDGARLGDDLERLGWRGTRPASLAAHPVAAYFEAHIEQGPVLEADGLEVGVVTGARGQRWYDAVVTGREAHAGPTPMRLRQDALVTAATLVLAVEAIGAAHGEEASATVGILDVHPHSRNVIPGRCTLTIDLRHADTAVLDTMEAELKAAVAGLTDAGRTVELRDFWSFPVLPFDPGLVERVRAAAAARGLRHRDIVSGAGHDAVYMSMVVPTAMVFIPCVDGISHNPAEAIDPAQAATGCAVLCDAVLATAERDPLSLP
ncbi:Zn-dependent hydrolase [Roseospira marina]|uniref:Zn-dependent hydrolase n=1 Tax=Roseospira marina TaxID=140057 RepID=A0A5M6IF80_9PROT|nr:Zn-dependent hydrolase [Roseospira marina]KAA5606409.1 Zn-dependent hydrolase [Roseospira marina]MBB4314180.1 N-carbamoyl-L-amino-acid hydrolase [Roseospira marina]MBB5087341.1 N-carbamoyl-L-amino-acid hydrolase [Roseospira marina]